MVTVVDMETEALREKRKAEARGRREKVEKGEGSETDGEGGGRASEIEGRNVSAELAVLVAIEKLLT
jgi:hypothetical protein